MLTPGGKARTAGSNGEKITSKQLAAVWIIARKLGMTADQLRDRCMRAFGAFPEHLHKSDASALITELSAAAGNDAAASAA